VPIGGKWNDFLGLRITGPKLTIIVMVPLLVLALAWFLNRTVFGQTVQASASNADLARLSGIDPKIVSLFVWTVAGALSSVSLLLLSGNRGAITGIPSLGPNTMTRALAAAVIAGMVSFPRASLHTLGCLVHGDCRVGHPRSQNNTTNNQPVRILLHYFVQVCWRKLVGMRPMDPPCI